MNLKAAIFMDSLLQKSYEIPVLRKIKFGKQLAATYSPGHASRLVNNKMNCTGLEKQ